MRERAKQTLDSLRADYINISISYKVGQYVPEEMLQMLAVHLTELGAIIEDMEE